jgi:hypothetical protein
VTLVGDSIVKAMTLCIPSRLLWPQGETMDVDQNIEYLMLMQRNTIDCMQVSVKERVEGGGASTGDGYFRTYCAVVRAEGRMYSTSTAAFIPLSLGHGG